MNATTPRAVGLLPLAVMILMAAGPAAAYIGRNSQATRRSPSIRRARLR